MKNINLKTFIHLAVGVVIVMWSALISMKVGNDFSGSILITITSFVVSCVFLWLVYFAIQAIVVFVGTFISPKKHLEDNEGNKEIVQTTQELDLEDSSQVKKKGPKKNFRMLIQYEDPDKLLKRLHELIDGNSGADVGAVLMNAFYNCTYLKRKPTQAEFESEFKLIGSWSAIKNYMDDNSLNATERASKIVIFED